MAQYGMMVTLLIVQKLLFFVSLVIAAYLTRPTQQRFMLGCGKRLEIVIRIIECFGLDRIFKII